MSSTATEVLNLTSNNSQNAPSNPTITSATNANQTPNEQQRRNKKRKPPNYYQSAEYANIIKHSQDLSNQANNSTSTADTSTTTQLNTNESFNENKQQEQEQEQPTNGSTQSEANVSNGEIEMPNDKTHSQRESNDLSESLKTMSLNEQSNGQSKDQSQQQQQQAEESNQNESNKKWSSLFKATAAPVTSQTASLKQVNNNSTTNKTN
jgi:hypothetical protein